MSKMVILGSSYAIPHPQHDNTHMAVIGPSKTLLIDCASNPIVRLEQANISTESIQDLILTHFHPDHVSGVPLFLMSMWLQGRTQELNIYGLDYTIDRIEAMLDLFNWSAWPGFFPVHFRRIPEEEMTPVLKDEEWKVYASPVKHIIPTIGLRIEFNQKNTVVAYSADTEPCPEIVLLAKGADILFHEATGIYPGHSSANQAAGVAKDADVNSLYLIHYPTRNTESQSLVAEARKAFNGKVFLTRDFMELEI
jgi:ribonuclease Z